jgi:putative transcriptional regulator
MREFGSGMNIGRFCKKISASMLVERGMDKPVYGYTIIDSFKAITEFSFEDLVKLYGPTTQRALIFTKVTTGRTPMVAMKLTNLHPALVVLHGLDSVDDVAKRIAEVEGIPLALCRLDDINRVTEKLKK